MNNFLINSIPENKIKTFRFKFPNQLVCCNDYFYSLRDAVSKFTEEVWISDLALNYFQFCSIMKSAKRVKCLKIMNSTILAFPEWDFGEMKDWRIKHLYLNGWGNKSRSNWKQVSSRLEYILQCIEKWENLRNSLETINLTYKGINNGVEMYDSILKGYPKLKHINFIIQ